MRKRSIGSASGSEGRLGRLLHELTVRRDRALRWALRFAPPGLARVAIDAGCPAWLGLAPERLFTELVRRRIWPIPLNSEDLERIPATGEGASSSSTVDTAIYQLCIKHELLQDELAAAMRTSGPIADEYRMALEAARQREAALDRLAARLNFRAVAYMQGYTPIAAAMRGIARQRGIGMLALENTLFNDRVAWDDEDGIACFTTRSRSAHRRHAEEPASKATGAATWELEGGLRNLKSAEHTSGTRPIASGRPYVLFLGQVFTDASIVFGCQPGWDPLQVVDHVRRWLPGSGMSLVIKGHPKEAGGSDPVLGKPYGHLFARRLRTTFPDIAAAGDCVIDADNRLDTYAAIRAAACVVTMNSQAGIEAAALGVPTIVCARAHYAQCGFTFDGSTPAALADSLRGCLVASHEERLRRRRIAVDFVGTLRDRVFVPRTATAIAELITRVTRDGIPRGGNA